MIEKQVYCSFSGKIRYDSQIEANKVKQRIAARAGSNSHIYRCAQCNDFHISREKQFDRTRKKLTQKKKLGKKKGGKV